MKKPVQLRVNGRVVSAEVEPRMQLADYVRDHLLLTGTHLGCEHGVCGACTVEIDGAPARSCIAYAVACDGAEVRTIEGFDDDPVMAELREAFSAEHALQCGYCTPGMLVTARDIVLRLPDANEARVREELSGNLCRCTGYVGIVRAIESVLARRKAAGVPRSPVDSSAAQFTLSPAVHPFDSVVPTTLRTTPSTPLPLRSGRTVSTEVSLPSERPKPQTTLHESFSVAHPRDKVWEFFGRLDEVTACLPGAAVVGQPTADHVAIKLRIKVSPIVAEFEGSADVARDPTNFSGTIHGSARDMRSSSATRGEIRYVLHEEKGGAATRVDLDVGFTLTGPLAQFSRSGIVQDIAKRMTAAFAQNLETRLNTGESGAPAAHAPAELNAGSLFFSVVWDRVRKFFRALGGR